MSHEYSSKCHFCAFPRPAQDPIGSSSFFDGSRWFCSEGCAWEYSGAQEEYISGDEEFEDLDAYIPDIDDGEFRDE